MNKSIKFQDKMPAKKLTLDPDVVLEWLLDREYVEPTESAIHPYRIAVSDDDFLPYSLTFLTNALSRAFSKVKLRAGNKKPWRRELLKCFEEHGIRYDDKGTRGSMFWQFQETTRVYLEKKLHIDLDTIHEYDSAHRNNGGIRYTSYWHQQLRRYGEDKALRMFKRYYERRMADITVDMRTKRLPKSEYDK